MKILKFQDIKKLEKEFKIFATLFSVDILDTPVDLQLELIDLQNDIELRTNTKTEQYTPILYFLPTRKVS